MKFIIIDTTDRGHILIPTKDDCQCCLAVSCDVKDDYEVLFRHATIVDVEASQ